MIEILFIAFCIIWTVSLIQNRRHKKEWRKLMEKIPGPKSYPIFGNTQVWKVPRYELLRLFQKWTERYGFIYKIWFGKYAVVRIEKPEAVEALLSSRTQLTKPLAYKFMRAWLSTGLLTSKGDKWRKRRKMLVPAFRLSLVENFFDTFLENGTILLEKLEPKLKSDGFDMFLFVNNAALDIICETAMGVKINAQSEPSEYIHAIKVFADCIFQRTRTFWLWPNFVYKLTRFYKEERKSIDVLHKMSRDVIRKRRQIRKQTCENGRISMIEESGKLRKMAFLDLLLDISENSNQEWTDDDIREEVDTFLSGGYETISAGLSWTIYLLGLHHNIQNKVVSELKDVLGTLDRQPNVEDMAKLNYMGCVIKESWRLYPPIPTIARFLTENTSVGDYVIPAGTAVEIYIYLLHRNPNHFPDPETFDPENFNMERSKLRHPYAYIPFSAGPRSCIGQKYAMLETKVLLTMLLCKYEVTSLDKVENLRLIAEGTLRSECGIQVRISERIV